MPCGLVLGMNDHQESCWVLIVVTHTHRQLSANVRHSHARVLGYTDVLRAVNVYVRQGAISFHDGIADVSAEKPSENALSCQSAHRGFRKKGPCITHSNSMKDCRHIL